MLQLQAFLLFQVVKKVLQHPVIKVDTSQCRVATGGDDLVDRAMDVDDGKVKGASPQVEDQHPLFQFSAQSMGEGSRSGFVQQTEHIEASQRAGRANRLALALDPPDPQSRHGLYQVGNSGTLNQSGLQHHEYPAAE